MLINEKDLKVDLKVLRENKRLFWNLIYYFNVFNIPYALILPYFDDRLKDFLFEQNNFGSLSKKLKQEMNDIKELNEEDFDEEEKRRTSSRVSSSSRLNLVQE
mmetsp:Transcript_41685/g.40048  ORF Transcript_41685/g.40048 Transcript_41685/m.40048 type:complete len:103 (+) Transcript_41685:1127-1435(+)